MRTKILLAVISFIVGYTAPSFAIGEKHFDAHVFSPFSSVLKVAKDQDRPILLIVYDEKSPTKSQMDWGVGNFFRYKESRKLVKENFVAGITKKSDPDILKYLDGTDLWEECRIILLTKEGKMLNSEIVFANPEYGIKALRAYLSQMEKEKYNSVKPK